MRKHRTCRTPARDPVLAEEKPGRRADPPACRCSRPLAPKGYDSDRKTMPHQGKSASRPASGTAKTRHFTLTKSNLPGAAPTAPGVSPTTDLRI